MTLVTEKEAAEKWCPYGRHVPEFEKTTLNTYQHRGAYDTPSSQNRCIGSRCMAWQWAKTNVKIAGLSAEDRSHYESLNLVRDEDDQELVTAWRTYGYCGAFGKVEP